MSWTEVRARFSPAPEDFSPFVDLFVQHGIENTLEERDSLVGCYVDVDGTTEQVERLRSALLGLGATEVVTRELPEVNWEEAWKQFFKPRRVGERFVVRPTWEEFEAGPDDLVIVLDPGQAFGTGDHPTTRMCLELLEGANVSEKSVYDLGCGSGILSVGAKLLGAASVMGTDVDPLAVEVAKENATRNSVRVLFETADGVATPENTRYDLVVSNIISAVLIRLAPDVLDVVATGGQWIVSGIIDQNWPDVLSAAEKEGFRLLDKRQEDGWVAARFQAE